jgi:hypothetical protein
LVLRFFYVCNKVVSRPFKFISYFGQQRHGLLLARYKEKSGYKPRVMMVKIRNMMKLPRRAAIQVFSLLFFRDLIIAE